MNEYDTNRIYDLAKTVGYEKTNFLESSDCYILNTCHIREKATEKTFSDLGRFNKKGKKDQKVIVAGCVAQAEGELIQKRAPYVDLIIGPQSIQSLNKFLKEGDFKEKTITKHSKKRDTRVFIIVVFFLF